MKPLKIFTVMLEGTLDNQTGFFVSVDVAAASKEEAHRLAVSEFVKLENNRPELEEIEIKEERSDLQVAQVLKVYGRSFFPLTEDELKNKPVDDLS